MWRSAYSTIYELALDQYGYVTTAQAVAAGVSGAALRMMARRGVLERLDHGIYRVLAIPSHPLNQYAEATLWPRGAAAFVLTQDAREQLGTGRPVTAVLSHTTALELYDLSDANPARIHLTVPPTVRVRRDVPAAYLLHHATLTPEEITVVAGLPVTTPARTIRDCAVLHLGPALLGQAIDQARSRGLLRAHEVKALETLVFDHEQARAS